jgi:hypothetical protein
MRGKQVEPKPLFRTGDLPAGSAEGAGPERREAPRLQVDHDRARALQQQRQPKLLQGTSRGAHALVPQDHQAL